MSNLTKFPSATLTTPADHATLGAELTELYHEAVEGNMRILAFGARLLEVEHLVSTRGIVNSLSSKSTKTGSGLKGWLETNAPEISVGTAWRWKDIAEATAKKFKVGNPSLVFGADLAALSDGDRTKRDQVWGFVQEKSQRGLQLELKLVSRRAGGGDTRSAAAKAAQVAKGTLPKELSLPDSPWVTEGHKALWPKLDNAQRIAWLEWMPRVQAIAADLADPQPIWPHLDDVTKDAVIDVLEQTLANLSPRHAALRRSA